MAEEEKLDNKQHKQLMTTQWIGVTISIVSIIISVLFTQKPFAKTKIIVEPALDLAIEQQWGGLNFYHAISFSNLGDKSGIVESIEAELSTRDLEKSPKKFIAKYFNGNYFNKLSVGTSNFNFWTGDFRFEEVIPPETKLDIAVYKNMLINEAEKSDKKDSIMTFKTKQASVKTQNLINSFVNKRLQNVTEGQYNYVLTIKIKGQTEPIQKRYVFYLSKIAITLLYEQTKEQQAINNVRELMYSRPLIDVELIPAL